MRKLILSLAAALLLFGAPALGLGEGPWECLWETGCGADTVVGATPTLTLYDSDHNANATIVGTGSAGPDMSVAINADIAGVSTEFVRFDGSASRTYFSKNVTFSAGVLANLVFQPPYSSAPAMGAVGRVGIDTTDNGVAPAQFIYTTDPEPQPSPAPDAVYDYVMTGEHEHCQLYEDLGSVTDKPVWMQSAYEQITLRWGSCVCVGACNTQVAVISFEVDELNSDIDTDVTGVVTCGDSDAADPDQINVELTGDDTLDQYDVLRFDTDTAPNPTTDDYLVCFTYRIVRQ